MTQILAVSTLVVYLLAAYFRYVQRCYILAFAGFKPESLIRGTLSALTWPLGALRLLATSLGGFLYSPGTAAREAAEYAKLTTKVVNRTHRTFSYLPAEQVVVLDSGGSGFLRFNPQLACQLLDFHIVGGQLEQLAATKVQVGSSIYSVSNGVGPLDDWVKVLCDVRTAIRPGEVIVIQVLNLGPPVTISAAFTVKRLER